MTELQNAGNSIALAPARDDSALLGLERQFNELAANLYAVQRARDEIGVHSVSQSSVMTGEPLSCEYCEELGRRQTETTLAQLDPIERAIMTTPAHTIAGLGVKARHAAYVVSEYWEEPIDKIDWEAKAVRLLIEAVCELARVPLPFRNSRAGE